MGIMRSIQSKIKKMKRTIKLGIFGRLGLMQAAMLLMMALAMVGCDKDFGEQKPVSKYASADGVFVVNEGQFMAGNGDVTFYDKAKKSVSNNLFFSINNRPPGDIPQYMAFTDQNAYLVINNSNTIEVVSLDSFKVKATISGLEMPRQIVISGDMGYVSQIGSSKVAIISLTTNTIAGGIETGKSTDHMILAGKRLFVANWTSYFIDKPNNTVMVFDVDSRQLIDSLVVAKEPNSMVRDADGMIWVLSSGGYMGEEFPALTCIDPSSLQIVKTLVFSDKAQSPALLAVSKDRKSLHFVNGDVYKMSISDAVLPQSSFIPQNGRSIYGLAVDSDNGDVYLSDARDFQQPGKVYRYSSLGVEVDAFDAGINPSGIFFYRK
jgi:DNA-binding beta-propeller fold protein YncE